MIGYSDTMDMELQQRPAASDYQVISQVDTVTPENGTCSDHSTPRETENSTLFPDVQVDGVRGDVWDENDCNNDVPKQQQSMLHRELARMKKDLNTVVVCQLKLWMLIVAVMIIIVVIIVLSVSLCTVHHEDEDERFDRSAFVVPRFFSGNFTISNVTSMLEAPDEVIRRLEQKMDDIYNSSFALKRYFSCAKITSLRRDSVKFELQFLMPTEHRQLEQYTLSREMVASVLRQQLLEQDSTDTLYINSSSLIMQVGK